MYNISAPNINLTDITSGGGTAYVSGAPEFTPWCLMVFVLIDL